MNQLVNKNLNYSPKAKIDNSKRTSIIDRPIDIRAQQEKQAWKQVFPLAVRRNCCLNRLGSSSVDCHRQQIARRVRKRTVCDTKYGWNVFIEFH